MPERANFWGNKPVRLRHGKAGLVLADLRTTAHDLRLASGQRPGATFTPGRFTAGLHVRAGDARHLRWMLTKCFPEAGWLRVLDRILADDGSPGAHAYVATDSPRFLIDARQRFGARLVAAEDVAPSVADKLAEDLRDLVLLAQCARIIAPRMSNFSLAASLIAGIPRERPENVLGIADIVDDLTATAVRTYIADVRLLTDHLATSDVAHSDADTARLDEVLRTLVALEKRGKGTPRLARVAGARRPFR